MSESDGPSNEQLQRLVKLACRAPSGGNGQPWSFDWDGRKLEVFFDKARTPRVADPGMRGTWVQVGIILESLAIAASVEGFALQYDLHMPHVEGRSFATVRFTPSNAPASEHAAMLAKRFTDRRPYAGGTLDAPVFDRIRALFEGSAAAVHMAELRSDDLLEYMVEGDALFFSWPQLHRDTWVYQRWSLADAERKRDGVYFGATGLSYPMSRLLKAIGDRPAVIQTLKRHGLLQRLLRRRSSRALRSSAGMALLTIRSTELADLTAAGRLAMRAWLMVQEADYSLHVYGPPALFVYFKAIGCLPEDAPPGLVELLDRGEKVLRREFGIPDDEMPLLLWRVGLSPGPLPGPMWTLRRDLEDVLRISTPSTPSTAKQRKEN
jgi:hypothetical protein